MLARILAPHVARGVACLIALGTLASTVAADTNLVVTHLDESPNRDKIEAALNSQTNLEFPGNPLSDIAEFLSQIHEIPILLDERALHKLGISSDEEITLILNEVTLRSALTLMLAPHDLGFIIENETLQITSKERVMKTTDTRIYSIQTGELSREDNQQLVEVIVNTIAPDSWNPNTCGISGVYNSLVVTQTQPVHRQIEALLKAFTTAPPKSE